MQTKHWDEMKKDCQIKKCFFVECSSSLWLGVAKHLKQENMEVTYWSATAEFENDIKNNFPNTIYQNCYQAKTLKMPENFNNVRPLYDWAFNEIYLTQAQNLYSMCERFNFSLDLNLYQMKKYLVKGIGLWNAIIQQYRPDIIVFPNVPHVVYDFIIFTLARLHGIHTIMFEETSLNPEMYVLTTSDFEKGFPRLKNKYHQLLKLNKKPVISSGTQIYFNKIKADYKGALPPAEKELRSTFDNILSVKYFLQIMRYAIQFCISAILKSIKGEDFNRWKGALSKQKGHNLDASYQGVWGKFCYYLDTFKWKINSDKRLSQYLKLCSQYNKNLKYVYFPLSVQPERSSCPQGGIFVDIWLAIEMVSKAIPDDWVVYVKEHPVQWGLHGHICRSSSYYADLLQIPKVQLISLVNDPFEIIDNAQAVATISGTTGWEALVRGKPVITFGKTWYNDCIGVRHIKDEAECTRAINHIIKNPRVEEKLIKLFVQAIEESGVPGFVDIYYQDIWQGSHEQNEKNIAEQIISALNIRY